MSSGLRNLERFCRSKPFTFVSDQGEDAIRKRNRQHMFLPHKQRSQATVGVVVAITDEMFRHWSRERNIGRERNKKENLANLVNVHITEGTVNASQRREPLTSVLLQLLLFLRALVVYVLKDADINIASRSCLLPRSVLPDGASAPGTRWTQEEDSRVEVKTQSRAWLSAMLTCEHGVSSLLQTYVCGWIPPNSSLR